MREDLQHHEREAELAQRSAQVRALERSLLRPDLDELALRQVYRARAVSAVAVAD